MIPTKADFPAKVDPFAILAFTEERRTFYGVFQPAATCARCFQ
jgi:hypothetical protein